MNPTQTFREDYLECLIIINVLFKKNNIEIIGKNDINFPSIFKTKLLYMVNSIPEVLTFKMNIYFLS